MHLVMIITLEFPSCYVVVAVGWSLPDFNYFKIYG